MIPSNPFSRATRREFLQTAGIFAGGLALSTVSPLTRAGAAPLPDTLDETRARFGKAPITSTKLSDNLTFLSGPCGNVVVLNGPDGKLIVDTFTRLAWDRFKMTLDNLGNAPLKFAIDTHWHWDHTDNNANVRAAGATLIAHDNTLKRLKETHDLDVLSFHFDPSPENALPEKTFKESSEMKFSGERVTLGHLAPAHTDSDIYVHFQKANVLHLGDTFFNGIYCFIDRGTGGNMNGMIAAASKMLAMTDKNTKVVPGHGPLGNKDDLKKFRDMMVTARDRVEKLKSSGKSPQEVVAAKPFADLDPVWGKGTFSGEQFAYIVYTTL